MISAENSVTVNRPVEAVFTFVSDATNDPGWHTDILEASRTGDGPIGLGTVFKVRTRPFMGQSEGSMEITRWEPNRRAELQARMGPMRPRITYLHEGIDGTTRFTRRVDLQPPGLMRLMQPIMRGMFRKRNAEFVANLKRVLEEPEPTG
jgi:hypothetical protein